MLGVELLEDVGLELAVEADRLDDLLAFLMRRGFDEVGDLCRAKAGELAVRDAHPSARDVRDEGLDALPVDHRARVRSRRPSEPGRSRRNSAAARRVHADDRQSWPSTRASSISLARDQSGADEVDDVSSGYVADEEKLAGPSLEAAEVHRLALELGTPVAQLEDLRDRDEELPSGDSGDEAGDGRMRSGVRSDDQVVNSPDLLAVPVKQRAMDERREMDEFRGH